MNMKTILLSAAAGFALMFGFAGNAQAQYRGGVAINGGGIHIGNGRGFHLDIGTPHFYGGYGYGGGYYNSRPYYAPRPYYNPQPYRPYTPNYYAPPQFHPPYPHLDRHGNHYHYHAPYRRW